MIADVQPQQPKTKQQFRQGRDAKPIDLVSRSFFNFFFDFASYVKPRANV